MKRRLRLDRLGIVFILPSFLGLAYLVGWILNRSGNVNLVTDYFVEQHLNNLAGGLAALCLTLLALGIVFLIVLFVISLVRWVYAEDKNGARK